MSTTRQLGNNNNANTDDDGALLCLGLAAQAHASSISYADAVLPPVNFDEAISGDLSVLRDANNTFVLGAGVNRIAGRTLGGFGVVDGDDTDYLYFYVPEGYTLDSFTLRSSMNVSGSNLAANFMYSIYDCATVDCSGPSGGWALNAVQSVELDVLGERL